MTGDLSGRWSRTSFEISNRRTLGAIPARLHMEHLTEDERRLVENAKPYVRGETVFPKVTWEELGEERKCRSRKTTDDLRGYRFGDLVVLGWGGWHEGACGKRHSRWRCYCLLAEVMSTPRGGDLKNGYTTASNLASARKAVAARLGRDYSDVRTDKAHEHPLFGVWRAAQSRCEDPKTQFFYRYGGRGIRVCDRWQDFWTFVKDVGERPRDSNGDPYELERINVDGWYEPQNCCWLPKVMQSFNKERSLHYPTIKKLHSEGLNYDEIGRAIGSSGSSVRRALKHPQFETICHFQSSPPQAFWPDVEPTKGGEQNIKQLEADLTYLIEGRMTDYEILQGQLEEGVPLTQGDFRFLNLQTFVPGNLKYLIDDPEPHDPEWEFVK